MQQPISWWTRVTSWWRQQTGQQLGHLHFVMVTRRGCHLCDDAWRLLDEARQRYGFRLEAVDVDTDPELQRRHGAEVPVVMVDGKLRFRGTVNRALLERLLSAEASKANRSPG